MPEYNIQNLTPFAPGVSGNPNGRPKGIYNSKTVIERLFFSDIDNIEDLDGVPKRMKGIDACWIKQFKKAMNGDLDAMRELSDRWEGKVPNKNQISGDPDNPHGVNIVINRPEQK